MKIYYKPEIETVQSEGLLVVDKNNPDVEVCEYENQELIRELNHE